MVTEQTKKAASAKLAKAAEPVAAKRAGETGIKSSRSVSRQDQANRTYMWGVVWLACVTPLLILCLVAPQFTGAAGIAISSGLYACVGMASWVLPMISFAAAVHCFEFEVEKRINNKIIIPMLLFFAPFFAARCASQGGVVGNFIDGLFVSAVGKAGAWMAAVLGMFSILAFMWNVTAEEAVEGCKALSQFSNSALVVFCRSVIKALSQLWAWCISSGKRAVESLVGAKNKFIDQKRLEQEEKERRELAEKEEMRCRLMYEETGETEAISEEEPVKSLTCRMFFDDSDSVSIEKTKEEARAEQPPAVANRRVEIENTRKITSEQLLEEIERYNHASDEMIAASRKRAEAAELGKIGVRTAHNGTYTESESTRSGSGSGTGRQTGDRFGFNSTPAKRRPLPGKRITGCPSFGRSPEHAKQGRQVYSPDLKDPISRMRGGSEGSASASGSANDVYHGSNSVKHGLKASYANYNANERGSVTRGASYPDSKNSLGKKIKNGAVPEDKLEDVPLRPVRSSSSEGYGSQSASLESNKGNVEAVNVKRKVAGQPSSLGAVDTVEVPFKRPAPQSGGIRQEPAKSPFTDELDEKVKALKFADKLDSDIALVSPRTSTAPNNALSNDDDVPLARPAAVVSRPIPEDNGASSAVGTMQKLNALSPEERRKALGLGRRPVAAASGAALKDSKASSAAGTMQKLNALSPEERRKALGLGRRPAAAVSGPAPEEGGASSEVGNLQKLNALSPEERRKALGLGRRPAATTSGAAPEEDGASSEVGNLQKLNALSPEERRKALGLGRRPAAAATPGAAPEEDGASSEVGNLQKLNALSPEERRKALGLGRRPAAASESGPEKTDSEISAASLQKLNSLSPEERRKALGLGRRPAALPADPNENKSFSSLSPSRINALSPEERRRALGLDKAKRTVQERDRNSLAELKALQKEREGSHAAACDPEAALQALSSRRPAGNSAKAGEETTRERSAGKAQASFTRSSVPSLMRSASSRSASAARNQQHKAQPKAPQEEMSREAKLAAWRENALRARASFKRQADGRARRKQEASQASAADMPFVNELANSQSPALRPPAMKARLPFNAARRQLGAVSRPSKTAADPSADKEGGSAFSNDLSHAGDADFRKNAHQTDEPNGKGNKNTVHSAIGSPELLNMLTSEVSRERKNQDALPPQFDDMPTVSVTPRVRVKLSQFQSAVGELHSATWSEGSHLDDLLKPGQASDIRPAVNRPFRIVSAENLDAVKLKSPLSAVSSVAVESVSNIKDETAERSVGPRNEEFSFSKTDINLAASELNKAASAKYNNENALSEVEETDHQLDELGGRTDELPLPKVRSSADYDDGIIPADQLSAVETVPVAPAVKELFRPVGLLNLPKNSDVDCEQPHKFSKKSATEKVAVTDDSGEIVAEGQPSNGARYDHDIDRSSSDFQPSPSENAVADMWQSESAVSEVAESRPLPAAEETAELVAVDETDDKAEMAAPESKVGRFDLGLDGADNQSIDLDSILPRDRDRFVNLRPINLTGGSVYRNPIRPALFVASASASAMPTLKDAAPVAQAAPMSAMPTLKAAAPVAQVASASAMPTVKAAAPVAQAAPASAMPTVKAAAPVAQAAP
ncbi:MAG: DNA translocase FtsK 4TM domain-containing protein, partial [Candidatus Bruticola sp.]